MQPLSHRTSEPRRAQWRRRHLASLVAALALIVPVIGLRSNPPHASAGRLAAIVGAPLSGVQVQNFDLTQSASISLDFFPEGAQAPVTLQRPGVAPGAVVNIYVPNEPSLPSGRKAVTIHSDRRHGALARLDWPLPNTTAAAAAMYNEVEGGNEIMIPFAVINHQGRTSIIAAQNLDLQSTQLVTLELFRSSGGAPVATKNLQVQAGRPVTVDLGKDAAFAAVPRPHLGWARLSAKSSIAGMSFVDITTSPVAAMAFEGVPVGRASAHLFVPLFRNDFFGTTAISVANPGAAPVNVTLTYFASEQSFSPACRGGATFVHNNGPVTLGAGSSGVFSQANAPVNGTGSSGLPTKCFGSAIVDVSGGSVLATVTDADAALGTAAAYDAVPQEDASLVTGVPLFRRDHTDLHLSTGVQAMNTGSSPARATIRISKNEGSVIGCPTDCTATIQPKSSFTWYPPTMAELKGHGSFYGSAVVQSDQPLAVIVNDSSPSGGLDAAIFNGLADRHSQDVVKWDASPFGAAPDPDDVDRIRAHEAGHIPSI